MKQHIPNLITLANAFCGCIAVIFAVNSNFLGAAIFMFLGIFFDFFDGLVARKLNVQSALGVQLDSLADMITSGLVPGIVMYKLLAITTGVSTNTNLQDWNTSNFFDIPLLPLLGLFITLASGYRLAKFNIDDEQQSYFKGLPTPANAIFIVSLPLIVEFQNNDIINACIFNIWFLIGLTLLSCYMLNSGIKLFALKFKDFTFQNNANRYIFLMLAIVLLVVMRLAAIPIIIILYIAMSIISNLASSKT